MNPFHPLQLPWLLVATPQLMDPSFKRKVVMIVEHSATGSMGFILNQKAKVPLAELVSVPYVKIPPDIVAWMGGPVDRQSGVILAHRTLCHDFPPPAGIVCHSFDAASSGTMENDSKGQGGYSLSSSEDCLIELVDYFQNKGIVPQPADHSPNHHPLASQSTLMLKEPEAPRVLGRIQGAEFWAKQARSMSNKFPLAQTACKELYPFRFLIGYSGWGKGQLEEEIRGGAWIQIPAGPKLVFDTPWQELWHACMERVGVHPQAFAPSQQSFLH